MISLLSAALHIPIHTFTYATSHTSNIIWLNPPSVHNQLAIYYALCCTLLAYCVPTYCLRAAYDDCLANGCQLPTAPCPPPPERAIPRPDRSAASSPTWVAGRPCVPQSPPGLRRCWSPLRPIMWSKQGGKKGKQGQSSVHSISYGVRYGASSNIL